MKTIFLIIDKSVKTTLASFIKANTSDGVCMIDAEDVSTLEHLEIGETHHIPCGGNWCHIKRFEPSTYAERFELERFGNVLSQRKSPRCNDREMSTSEEYHIYSLENPER
jgi:hypothetical protein